MLLLGDVPLHALEVQTLSVDESWDFAKHAVIEGKPVRQFIAENAEDVTIDCRFLRALGNPVQKVNRLRELASAHEVVALQTDTGGLVGWFVVLSVSRKVQKTLPDGTLLWSDVTIKLAEDRLDPELAPVPAGAIDGSATPTTSQLPQQEISGDKDSVSTDAIVRK
jgi:phage protein U